MEERGRGSERWSGATTNLTEMASNLDSLQKLLLKKAVFVDDETFARASLTSEQARTIKVCDFDFMLFLILSALDFCLVTLCYVIQDDQFLLELNLIDGSSYHTA